MNRIKEWATCPALLGCSSYRDDAGGLVSLSTNKGRTLEVNTKPDSYPYSFHIAASICESIVNHDSHNQLWHSVVLSYCIAKKNRPGNNDEATEIHTALDVTTGQPGCLHSTRKPAAIRPVLTSGQLCGQGIKMHTPWWAIKIEREEEAKHPGPPMDDCDIIDIETSNITSGNTNKEIAFARKAAVQFLQEVGMNKGQRVDMAAKAIESKKRFIGGTNGPRTC